MENETSAQPLYYQIVLDVQAKITSGELLPGQRLPSERELMEDNGVSRTTVRKALKELAERGITEHRGKRGHFICQPSIPKEEVQNISLFDAATQTGREASSKVLSAEITESTVDDAALLGISPGSPVIKIKRLRFVDESPYGVGTLLLPGDLFAGFNPLAVERSSVLRIMREQYHIDIAYSSQTLVPIFPTREEANLLSITTKSPLLSIRSSTHDRNGRIVKYSDLHANTAIQELMFTWSY